MSPTPSPMSDPNHTVVITAISCMLVPPGASVHNLVVDARTDTVLAIDHVRSFCCAALPGAIDRLVLRLPSCDDLPPVAEAAMPMLSLSSRLLLSFEDPEHPNLRLLSLLQLGRVLARTPSVRQLELRSGTVDPCWDLYPQLTDVLGVHNGMGHIDSFIMDRGAMPAWLLEVLAAHTPTLKHMRIGALLFNTQQPASLCLENTDIFEAQGLRPKLERLTLSHGMGLSPEEVTRVANLLPGLCDLTAFRAKGFSPHESAFMGERSGAMWDALLGPL